MQHHIFQISLRAIDFDMYDKLLDVVVNETASQLAQHRRAVGVLQQHHQSRCTVK